MRGKLRLSWSQAVSGAELYDGEDIETFATDWHFHGGWQFVALSKGERHYQLRDGSIIAKPGRLVILPPRLVHKARCIARGNTSFKIATVPEVCGHMGSASTAICQSVPKLVDAFVSVFRMLRSANHAKAKAMILCRLEEIVGESISICGPSSSLVPPRVPPN